MSVQDLSVCSYLFLLKSHMEMLSSALCYSEWSVSASMSEGKTRGDLLRHDWSLEYRACCRTARPLLICALNFETSTATQLGDVSCAFLLPHRSRSEKIKQYACLAGLVGPPTVAQKIDSFHFNRVWRLVNIWFTMTEFIIHLINQSFKHVMRFYETQGMSCAVIC